MQLLKIVDVMRSENRLTFISRRLMIKVSGLDNNSCLFNLKIKLCFTVSYGNCLCISSYTPFGRHIKLLYISLCHRTTVFSLLATVAAK